MHTQTVMKTEKMAVLPKMEAILQQIGWQGCAALVYSAHPSLILDIYVNKVSNYRHLSKQGIY